MKGLNINESFYKIHSVKISCQKIKDPVILLCNDRLKFCIIDRCDMLDRGFQDDKIKYIYNNNNNIFMNGYDNNCVLYPFLLWKNRDDLLKEYNDNKIALRQLLYIINYNSITLIFKLEENQDGYSLVYYINKDLINDILQGKRVRKLYILENIINIKEKDKLLDNFTYELNKILENTIQCQDYNYKNLFTHFFKDNIKLYHYQLNDIQWMKNIESKVNLNKNMIEYQYNQYTITDIDMDMGIVNKLIYYKNVLGKYNNNSLPSLTKTFKYYGGNLISSMGLGKTIIMLCYIFEKDNTVFNNFVKDETVMECNYFYKRGIKKGLHCTNKVVGMYCKEHDKTLFIDKTIIKYNNLNLFDINDFIINVNGKVLFKTNSNLIICPSHLSDQWVREYYNKFKIKKRVLLIITYDQYSNLKFSDILFSDLIVISYNFLQNNKYNNDIFQFYKINKINKNNIQKSMNDQDKINFLNSTKYNLLHRFYYSSIILDESHEIINRPKYKELEFKLKSLKSKYRWNISGTPFANGIKGFAHQMSYISQNFVDNLENSSWELNDFLNQGITDNLIIQCNKLFKRNTTKSIQNEYSENIIYNHIIKLDFTEQERNIYNSYLKANPAKNYKYLIQLCCDPEINAETQYLVKNCKTFDEIQVALLDFNENKMINSQKHINNMDIQIKYLLLQICSDKQESNIEKYKILLGNTRRSLTVEKKNFYDIKSIYNFLKNAIDNIRIPEICSICLDNTDNDVSITKCGHKFCNNCINEYIKMCDTNIKCPKCNINISKNDIYLLKEPITFKSHTLFNLDNLINEIKSTKIGNIIYFLKNKLSLQDKCIVFSQWDHTLDKIGENLLQHNIKHVFCKGSVYQRKKDILKFCQGDTNIILLSSKNAASGINLTIANKIILVEPVYGSKEYRNDIENQSIGRANRLNQKKPIDVFRFIIKNTIEEDISEDDKNNILEL